MNHHFLHIVAMLFRGGIFLGMGYACLLAFENILEWEFDLSSFFKWVVVLAVILAEF